MVSAKVLAEYKELIANTRLDLEEHLEAIQDRLKTLAPIAGKKSNDERQTILKEMESTKHCISICTGVSEHIQQLQSNSDSQKSTESNSSDSNTAVAERNTPTAADFVLADSLNFCLENLSMTKSQLSTCLENMVRQLNTENTENLNPDTEGGASELNVMEAEAKSIRERLAYFSQASARSEQYRVNVFEDISAGEDSHQVIVSTVGDLISAKRITGGDRSVHLMGQMSDAALQQLSQDGRLPLGRDGPDRQP
jgi:hypothetical protein